MNFRCLSALFLAALFAISLRAADLNIFAAASLSEALKEIAKTYEPANGDKLRFNLAASSTLALQIKQGAPADVFFSADEAKMDDLAKAGLIVDGTRRITYVTEVLRMESDVITLQDIFAAKPPEAEEHNPTAGRTKLLTPLQSTGLKPQFLEKLAANGVVLPPSFFGSEEAGETPRSAFSATSFEGAFE